MATLTYVYSDSTAVLGPLATYAEPHSYDLCSAHAARLTAPRGWEVVRLVVDDAAPSGPSHDDLLALVEAVREAARPASRPRDVAPTADAQRWGSGSVRSIGRRGHLRVMGTPNSDTDPD